MFVREGIEAMETLIAIAHILGSIVAVLVFGFVVLLIAGWESARNQKQILEETAVALGIRVEDLDSEEFAPKILQMSSEKFSTELFKNRISDFCGLIQTMWGWVGNIIQISVLLAVIWYTYTDSTENAVYAWFVAGIAIIFFLASFIFSLICKLLTGRYPNQAKEARKAAAEWNRKLKVQNG
jgi:hypothetical protein